MRRAEGGANIFGVFRMKNHDFTPKNHIISNFRGGCAPGAPPPGSAPVKDIVLVNIHCPPFFLIKWGSLSVTCVRSVVFSGYSGFLHQYNWPPRYNWNIVDSGAKLQKPSKQEFFSSALMLILNYYLPLHSIISWRTY